MISLIFHLACEVYFKGVSTVFFASNWKVIMLYPSISPRLRGLFQSYFHRVSNSL